MLESIVPTLIGVGLLVAITAAVLWVVGVPGKWAPGWAILRAALQLAVIALVLRDVIQDGRWVAIWLSVMFAVAAYTVARRLGFSWQRLGLVVVAMLTGITPALAIAFGTGALTASPRYVLALGGIVIGGAMTIATLAGRRLLTAQRDRWDEVEGWLAIGATPRQANLAIAREAVAEALLPTIDQTRTTGLVTLPGSFVGAIFGGASPVDAGRFQLVVLSAVLAAGAVTAIVLLFALPPALRRPDAAG
ncbi:MAG: ABC transporter permease [Promicromonosporaceae bacterium]|nr:ABC transporter permease [Promicromonosporaceae bacterium]